MTGHTKPGGSAAAAPSLDHSAAVNYAQNLFATTIDWYKSADLKAQIILTLDGALIAFLTSSLFKTPSEVSQLTQHLTGRTWFLLMAMCVCLFGSIVSALMCLWSRIFLGGKGDSVLELEKKQINESGKPYSPNVMLFFRTISWLDHDRFQEQLVSTDAAFHIRALASQSYLLSRRVYVKHMLVNAGFVLSGASFLLFLASGMSYLAGLK
jgi:hypothetical protein